MWEFLLSHPEYLIYFRSKKLATTALMSINNCNFVVRYFVVRNCSYLYLNSKINASVSYLKFL